MKKSFYLKIDQENNLIFEGDGLSLIPVYYNPKNPNYVAIFPGVKAQMPTLLAALVAALVFLVLGGVFLYIGIMTILDPNYIYVIDDPSYGE